MSASYYYLVFNRFVFVTLDRSKHLTEKTLADLDTMTLSMVFFRDGKERRLAKARAQAFLEAEYKRDSAAFMNEWVTFDLVGDEARANLYRLLDTFVVVHRLEKFMAFRDIRLHSILGPPPSDARWPLGKKYSLIWLRKRWFRTEMAVEYTIDTDLINRVSGTLDGFVIETSSVTMHFGYSGFLGQSGTVNISQKQSGSANMTPTV